MNSCRYRELKYPSINKRHHKLSYKESITKVGFLIFPSFSGISIAWILVCRGRFYAMTIKSELLHAMQPEQTILDTTYPARRYCHSKPLVAVWCNTRVRVCEHDSASGVVGKYFHFTPKE
jgi:hypothetical protein